MRMKANIPLTEQLRQAILTCGKTRYAIAKETGVTQDILSRFVHGERGMSLESLDAVGQCLGLRIVADGPKPKPTKSQRQAENGKHRKGKRRAAAD
jgi:hypothetical protein